MPLKFAQFGVELLYPDNWEIAQRGPEDPPGVTFELPGGGFFSLDPIEDDAGAIESLYQTTRAGIAEDYGSCEAESLSTDGLTGVNRMVEFRFYYLDLIIQSRLLIVEAPENAETECFAIQYQAESRDFDKNELVFKAMLTQIGIHLAE
jgi:hypothetical protein